MQDQSGTTDGLDRRSALKLCGGAGLALIGATAPTAASGHDPDGEIILNEGKSETGSNSIDASAEIVDAGNGRTWEDVDVYVQYYNHDTGDISNWEEVSFIGYYFSADITGLDPETKYNVQIAMTAGDPNNDRTMYDTTEAVTFTTDSADSGGDDDGIFGGGGPGFTLPAVGAALASAAGYSRYTSSVSAERE